MQFERKTRAGNINSIIKILIKVILILLVLFIVILLIERIDLLEKLYAELSQFEKNDETDVEPPISSSGG